ALIEQPRRVHHQQPANLDAVRDVAELDLHALAIGKLDAETFALVHIGLRDLAAALGEPEPTHAMGEPRRPEPDLGDAQAIADVHQHVLVGHFEALENELAVAAMLLRAHDRNAPHDLEAWLVAMEEKAGEAAPRVIRGARDQNEMVGDAST